MRSINKKRKDMKNSLSKIVLVAMMIVSPLVAGYSYDTHSLFAIEGGVSDVSLEAAGGVYDEKEMANIGLKIGAQTDDYRVFLSGRYYAVDDLSSLSTFGGEVQYMFNFSEPVNFFLGVNGGLAKIKAATAGFPSESTSELYYGIDTGFNFHATKLIDLEVGVRYMGLQDAVVAGVIVDDIVTAYASVIIKWNMD